MTIISGTEEITRRLALGIPKGMKNSVAVSIVRGTETLTRNENVALEEQKTQKHLQIVTHRVTCKSSMLFGWLKIEESLIRV